MRLANIVRTFQVCYGPRHLERAMAGTRREPEMLNRGFKHGLFLSAQMAESPEPG
jgi:hypothetical protein